MEWIGVVASQVVSARPEVLIALVAVAALAVIFLVVREFCKLLGKR